MNITKFWIFDIETYLSAFTFTIIRADGKHLKTFECSERKNEIDTIFNCLEYLKTNNCYMVGFNNLNFDYPILHEIVKKKSKLPICGKRIASYIHDLAQKQIESFKDERFGNTIKIEEQVVQQIDLYKISHFDNRAKSTSLKMLEFNMRMQNIEDLPFPIDAELTSEQVDKLVRYNQHDVQATLRFFNESLPAISFRIQLTDKYNRSFLNHNDGKIGKDYFQMRLEELGVKLHTFKDGKKVIKQTVRDKIVIKDCLFDYYDFKEPAFIAIKNWFSHQVIRETKGVFTDILEHDLGDVAKYAELVKKSKKFKGKPNEQELVDFKKDYPLGWIEEKQLAATENVLDANGDFVMEYPIDEDGNTDFTKKMKRKKMPKVSYLGCWNVAETLNVVIGGFRFDFGTGGLHASLVSKIAKSTKSYDIVDLDVASMYPNLAISNNCYPLHLGKGFCDIYKDVYEQRKSYPKGSAENAMLKLALNSVYGDSNNQYSVFYDPAYTMQITLNGQLSLCLLVEKLLTICGLKIIQCNTDGITVALLKETRSEYDTVCKQWQIQVGLQLEFAQYNKMVIRDVNNYIGEYTDGSLKSKGAYQYKNLEWHKNTSCLVVPMCAEAVMLQGVDPVLFIKNHFEKGNVFDFMLRTKVPRSSRLIMQTQDGVVVPQQRICRYYPSKNGGKLIKIMPPIEQGLEERQMQIESQWFVKTCNNMNDFDGDIDFDYYLAEVQKLLMT